MPLEIQLGQDTPVNPPLTLNVGSTTLNLGEEGGCVSVNVLKLGTSSCPVIDSIDGGQLSLDSDQFAPINGFLNGGSL